MLIMTLIETMNQMQFINQKSRANTKKAKALLNLSDVIKDESISRKIEKQLNHCDKLRVYYNKQRRKVIAGSWLIASVCIDRITHISSASCDV